MALRLPAIERKEQVLDVALAVFAVKGFHDTSMNDIAEAAGVTKPVVYQHYESKRALFLAIIDHVGDRMIDVLTAATSGLTDGHDQVEAGTVAFFKCWVVFARVRHECQATPSRLRVSPPIKGWRFACLFVRR